MGLIGLQTQLDDMEKRHKAELDAAYAQLHALAEWVDAVKKRVHERCEKGLAAERVSSVFGALCATHFELEGGWDATGGDDEPNA